MLNSNLIVGFSSLIIVGIAYFVTRDLSRLGGVFVNFTLWAILVLSILEIAKGLIKPEKIAFFKSAEERNNVIVGVGILAVYLIVLPLVGFLPSSLLFFAVMNLYLTQEKISQKTIIKSVLLSVVVVAVFYLVFRHLLEVPLPEGALFTE